MRISALLIPTMLIAALSAARNAAGDVLPAQTGQPELHVSVVKASTAGRAPVAIMLHGGGGLDASQTAAFADWSSWLATHGVASVIVDSFRGRGIANFHFTGNRDAYLAMIANRVVDARRTIEWLRMTSWADPAKVLVFGQSQGAIVGTHMSLETDVRAPQIAFYNGCDANYFASKPASANYPPSLWLLGGADEVARSNWCETFVKRMAEKGGNASAIKLIVFPDAHHTFDWQQPRRMWGNRMLEFNKAAYDGSRQAIISFLQAHGYIP